jgi:hypothetical protein
MVTSSTGPVAGEVDVAEAAELAVTEVAVLAVVDVWLQPTAVAAATVRIAVRTP